MKQYKYTGTFKNMDGNTHTLEVFCIGLIQAFILLTAEALKQGKHYQLDIIESETGQQYYVDDISELSNLFTNVQHR